MSIPSLRPLLVATLALLLLVPAVATAHEERESVFPPYDAPTTVPEYRPFAEATPRLVVCKPDSEDRIAAMEHETKKALATDLLDECTFEHLQAAVDAVTVQGTNIYVLPGEYFEEPSVDAACAQAYDGGVVEYELIVSCGEVINLVTVAGDSVEDEDILCDNQLCDLQIEGLGDTPQDVLFTGGFNEDGDWRKHNGIKADRADGFVLKGVAFELFRENAIYIHETSGYLLDDVEANYNDLYGILTFTSDRGVISNCNTHHNGDSGIYPGSAADVNQEANPETGELDRWSVEIFGCETHHNALGFSGTAGNSVYFHDNLVHHNAAGYVTDSFVGGHPGMPQDHAWLVNNRIFSNNVNYFLNVQGEDAPCQEPVPADRGHQDGVVCPVFPVPVGTGVLIAGGNANFIEQNDIYDNWRNGVMQFYVPAALRYQRDIQQGCNPDAVDGCLGYDFEDGLQVIGQYIVEEGDTSNDNRWVANSFGLHPVADVIQPNGLDVWWDDQGLGNCWDENISTTEDPTATVSGVSHNSASPALPTCDIGSPNPAPNPSKSGVLLPCAEYHRYNNPEPPLCDWYDSQTEPAGRQAAEGDEAFALDVGRDGTSSPALDDRADSDGAADADGAADGAAADDVAGGNLAATGGGALLIILGSAAIGAASQLRRRRDDEADA